MNLRPLHSSANTISKTFKTSEKTQITEDLRYINRVLYPLLAIGFIIVFSHLGLMIETTTALLWGFTCIIAGSAIGFLFGIPKVLQNDRQAINQGDTQTSEKQITYRQQVNTNLTEISDWLTKIIVGVTLINLVKIPPYISRLGDIVAIGLNSADASKEKSFALAIVIFFPVLGFFFGYLYTRLFLAGAFSRADQNATESEIRQVVNQEGEAASSVNLIESRRNLTERQLEASGKVAKLASHTDISVVKQQMIDLAQEYEWTRTAMSSGDERTRKMETIVVKMRTLALASYSFLSEFAESQSSGQRLAAVAILQVNPNSDYLEWLASRLAEEKPFLSYHSTVALLTAVRTLEMSKQKDLQNAIEKAKGFLGNGLKNSDRYKVLEEALKELFGTD